MKQLVLLFLVTYAVERIVETFWKWKKIKGKIIAPYSLHLLVGTYVLIYLIIFWKWGSLEMVFFAPWIALAGMGLVLASMIGRNWAIHALGLYHSIHVEIRENHELIQSGPYRFVRNPYYLSNMVEAIGLPLVANAWIAGLISIFLYMPILVLRMILEERALEDKFKGSFIDYKKQAPRIVPKLFCVRGKS